MPLLGGVIGYFTNYLAVRMIFRPIHPRRILGFQVQGLIGRRQGELATSIGRVVGGHLVQPEDLAQALSRMDLEKLLDGALASGLESKLAELRRLPMVGALLTEERVADLRRSVVKSLVADREGIAKALESGLEQGLDVEGLVEEKVAGFPIQRLETMILEVASKELKTIEILGGVLGTVIGVLQVGVLAVLNG